jgi:hypothetical protein
MQAHSLAKDCYAMKLGFLTNATVVDDAIRFVTEQGKSVGTVSSGGATAGMVAIKCKINTPEWVLEECTHPLSSTTTN